MRKVSPRLVAIMMASVVSVTSIAPVTAYNHVTVNAAQLQQQAIDWTFTGNGKVDNDKIQLSGAGDNIGITNIKKEDNYAVKAKLAQGEEDGAVGVMMGAKEAKDPKKGSVVANVTPSTGAVRLICFQGGRNNDLQKEKVFDELKNKDTYDFDISVKQRHLTVKINGVKVISMEITDTIFEGKVGLISFNETMTASDFSVEDIAIPKATAHLTNLQVTGGDLDKKYTQDTSDYAITVPNTVDKLSITPTVSDNGTVTIGEQKAENGKATEVSLQVGSQEIPITVTSTNGAVETTTLHVLRNVDGSAYTVPTRPQYHFSQAMGWSNDPNGMLYYKGEWHLFFQYNQARTTWGELEWGHAVSKDLIHWEELPRPLNYQEDNGAMFSGCGVVDDENTSGLFGDEKGPGKGGLIALYTQNNELNGHRGQDQCIAYSKDNGRTWTKYKGNPILKWDEDHLKDTAFRDPKVFRHDGKWFMVLAGGILRIYSSDDLIHWNIESTYKGSDDIGNPAGLRVETECPDMYPLTADDGTTKWVISEGGRYYRIGDLKKIDGHWTFVQDKDSDRYVMNFGPHSYAAMTYYIGNGETTNGKPENRRIMINWASTWADGYCNNVDKVTGQWGYNGFFNLQTELNVKKIDGKYKLVQTPIDEYKTLRVNEAATKLENVTIPKKTENSENLLSGVKAGQYEVVAELTPQAGTKEVGFKLRTNKSGSQETVVSYNTETKKVSINGEKSGTHPAGQQTKNIVSDAIVTEKDGKVKLDIFVDESSVEVYGQDGQVTGALAVFPSVSSTGMEVYSEGGETTGNITVYPMKSIWENKITDANTATDLYISTDSGSGEYNVGDKISVNAAISPMKADQKVTWKVSNNKRNKVKVVKTEDDELQLEALKEGSVTVTATTANGLSRSIDIFVSAADDGISLSDWKQHGGKWKISENSNSCTGEASGDAFLMSGTKISSDDYIFESDVVYHSGQAFALLFRGQNPDSTSAYAANVDTQRKGSTARIFTFGGGTGDIGKDGNYNLSEGQKYHFKVVVKGNQYKVYIEGKLVLNVRDVKVENNYKEGRYVGFNVFNGKVTFQNMKVTPLEVKVPTVSDKLALTAGEKAAIDVSNIEDNSFNIIKYKSLDKTIADVDEDGNITAKKAGTTQIETQVTTFGRSYTYKTQVTVKEKEVETPKVSITATLKGNAGKTVTTIKDVKAGDTLPAWNKAKYKAAGKKGYVFAGWTYNGKIVTKMPESDKNITLTAKFVKVTVGKAGSLSVRSKAGKGVGFVARSTQSVNKYGEKRGFRFRYSTSKKMKSAKYKTTGLAKNVYTKTGLKKGKKYYVQVRYYYYDSTNQKVYGAYSKAKSVKAY